MRGCAYLASHPCRRGSNKHMKLSFLFFVAVVFYICLSVQAAEEKPEVLYTSPSGAFRVVQVEVTPTGDDESGRAVGPSFIHRRLPSQPRSIVRPENGGCS